MRIQDKISKLPSGPPGEKKSNITIHACAETGNLVGLQRLLRQKPSLLNEKSILMLQTPLHIAASLNRVEIVKYLLDWAGPQKVELEAKNVYRETPLHVAAKNGCNEAVRMLLDYGVNVEARTNNSMTPLHLSVGYALRSGDNSTVKTLSEYKADFSAKDNMGMAPFNYLPVGHENDELSKLVYQNIAEEINNFAQQIHNMTGNSFNNGSQNAPNAEGINNFVQQIQNMTGNSFNNGSQNVVNALEINNLAQQVQNLAGFSWNNGSQNAINAEEIDKFSQQIQNMTGYSWNYGSQNATNAEGINNFAQQIQNMTGSSWNNGSQNAVEQCSYSAMESAWLGYQNVEKPMNYDTGIKGKMEEFDSELSKIVGLHELKEQLRKWAKGLLLDEKRRAMGLNLGPRKPPHMAFLGNPGTGKTTVARILGKLLHSVGVLSSDNMIEVQRTDLVGEYLGQTGPKTRKKIEEAMGGILFVDEAYRLAPAQSSGDHVDYGVEALEEIMSVLEDGQLVLIFAGYTEPMKRVFSSNEGFCRRVTHFFQFDDFTCKDLAEMVMIKMSKQDEKSRLYGFKLHPSCTYEAVLKVIERCSSEKLRNKMNGGLVDHMLNNARESLDSRLNFESNGDDLLTITMGDLEAGLQMLSKRVSVD